MVIDGEATHAVRKSAAPGEFRVQDDHGGTVHPHEPNTAERGLAERAIVALPSHEPARKSPMLASIWSTHPDGPQVMELELIEPELFFRNHPPAADRLAHALLDGI